MNEKLIKALKETTAFVIGERDAFYDCCSDREGNVPIVADVEVLAEMDEIINRAEAAIKETSEGKQTVSVLQKGYVLVSVETIRKQIESEPTRTIKALFDVIEKINYGGKDGS